MDILCKAMYLKGIKFRGYLFSQLEKKKFCGYLISRFGNCEKFNGYLISQFQQK